MSVEDNINAVLDITFRDRHKRRERLEELLERGGCNAKASEFKRYGSARQLYNFNIDNAY